MPLVSLIDLEKSLNLNTANNNNTNNLLLGAGNNKELIENFNNLSINNSNNKMNQNNNNNANLLLQQKLLLNSLIKNDYINTLSQLTNSTLLNANNLQSLLLNTNLLNNISLNTNLLSNGANQNSSQNSQNSSKQINYSRYKTELCRQFNENGECKYGDKCQFAHGLVDLKDVNRHPKYKTDFCKTFHSKGFCPYGPRCHFIHDLSEKFENSQNSNAPISLNNNLKPSKINLTAANSLTSQESANLITTTDLLLASKLKQSLQLNDNIPTQQLEDYVMSLSILSNSGSLSPSTSSSSKSSTVSPLSNQMQDSSSFNLPKPVDYLNDEEDCCDDNDDALSDPFQSNNPTGLDLGNLLLSSPINKNHAVNFNFNKQQPLRSRSMTSSTSSAYSTASSTSSINTNNEFNNQIRFFQNSEDFNEKTNQLLKSSNIDFCFQ